MKKVRKITILIETKEVLFTRSKRTEKAADLTSFAVCPVCNSQLDEPLPLSVNKINSTALTEIDGNRTQITKGENK